GGGSPVAVLARVTAGGGDDATFDGDGNGDGVILTPFTQDFEPADIVRDGSGRLVVGGSGDQGRFALARYAGNGALDTTFGSGGKVTQAVGVGYAYGERVAVDGDGRVLIAGVSDGDKYVALGRFTDGGAPDLSFDGDGLVTTSWADRYPLA